MARYNPPTKGSTLPVPYQVLVTRADPDWAQKRHREVEYEFSGRVFVGDPDKRGSYSPMTPIFVPSETSPIVNASTQPVTTMFTESGVQMFDEIGNEMVTQ